MSKPDAFMPLYVGDYLGDTQHLSAAEHGAYLLLLMHAWRSDAPLPDDERVLARIARMAEGEWAAVRGVVLAFFHRHKNGWRHRRVERERVRATEKYDARKAASEIANRARRAHRDGDQPQSQPQSESEPDPELELEPERRADVSRAPTRWPGDAVVSEDWIEDARAARVRHGLAPADLALEAERFANYWAAKAGAGAARSDWRRTWINWALRSNDERRDETRSARGRAHAVFAAEAARTAFSLDGARARVAFGHSQDDPTDGGAS